MQHRIGKALLGLAMSLVMATGVAIAQGSQTGTLTGNVTAGDGSAMPGVTVTATSSALQGARTTVTGVNGDFVLRALPPGMYKVLFTLEGMQSVETEVNVLLGATARADAQMQLAAAEDTIVVTGEAPSALETTVIGTNLEAEVIDQLAVGRNPAAVADLAPGLTNNTPVGGQVTINGAMAYDNAILINGVNTQDPIFGQTNNLFIEEAIEETQVLTSGITAEYGGFTGGVINAITKSGGNQFTGTIRTDLTKADWRDETPFEDSRGIEREGSTQDVWSATLGGPIVRDRLWFFLAGRTQGTQVTPNTLRYSGIAYNLEQKNDRYEVKLTGAITPNHSVQLSYINNDRQDKNNRQLQPIEPAALMPNAEFPNDGTSIGYTGIFTSNLYGELRYAEKAFQFKGLGGTGSDIINDSPYYGYGYIGGVSGLWNAPYFDATDPEDRDNEEITATLSYFLSSQALGSHDIKVGYDQFTVTRTGGNSQSPTNHVWGTEPLIDANGDLVYDSTGRLIPVFEPGLSFLSIYIPTRGAELDITTDSLFVNDRWNLNKNFSFNIGLRYEAVTSEATGNITTIDTDVIAPRLGASWDIKGDGKWKVDVTYADYAGRYNPSVFGRNSPVGNPLGQYYVYVGPAGQGRNFAPGYDLNNYELTGLRDPARNIFFDSDIQSPIVTEYTMSFGFQLPKGGYGKLTYVNRESSDFVDDFIDTTCTVIGGSCIDNVIYRNTSTPERTYEGVQFSGQYRITDNWTINGNWTYQLKNEGDYEGEGGQSIGTSPFGNRNEIFPASRNNPKGRFDDYQEHKIRVWTNYNLNLGRAGNLGIGLLGNYDSALTFSYTTTCPTTAQMRANNPGYRQVPGTFTCFFGERGAGEFDDFYTFDLAINYSIPVWKSLEPWVKFSITNLLNYDDPVTWNTSIVRNAAGPVDQYGIPTTFTPGALFGQATSNGNYLVPREYFIAAGIRF
jgi:hypothetical protein